MNKQKIKVCVFTAARSDYFLLRPLLHRVQKHKSLNLQLVVSGMHMSADYGETWRMITKDGFSITEKIATQLSSNDSKDVVASMGLGMICYANTLTRLSPDVVVILGDRFEMMSFATAAYILRVPIAHIHGGELTYGSFDDGIRHCITKMSTLHFPAAEVYRKRIIQMGEDPNSVFNVGALAVENINSAPKYDIQTLSKMLGIPLQDKFFLVTCHPETSHNVDPLKQVKILIEVLSKFSKYQIIWTISNADPKGNMINNFLREQKTGFFLIENLGDLYIPVLKQATAIIGNSSSGIIEASILGVPTINIGDRQGGRVRVTSIVDCLWNIGMISKAILKVTKRDKDKRLSVYKYPYGDGRTSLKITQMLAKNNFKSHKFFYDLPSLKIN